MASAATLTDEIDEILQEDHSLSEQWSDTNLFNLTKHQISIVGAETLCRDVSVELVADASGLSFATPSDYIAGYHVRWLGSVRMAFQDFRTTDLASGITNPWASGTPQFVNEVHKDDDTQILRLQPKYGTSGGTCTLFYKAEPDIPSATTSGVSLSDWFVLPVKYRVLGNAYSVLGDIQNPQKAKIFTSLGDVLGRTLKSLFQGGQFI